MRDSNERFSLRGKVWGMQRPECPGMSLVRNARHTQYRQRGLERMAIGEGKSLGPLAARLLEWTCGGRKDIPMTVRHSSSEYDAAVQGTLSHSA